MFMFYFLEINNPVSPAEVRLAYEKADIAGKVLIVQWSHDDSSSRAFLNSSLSGGFP